MSEKISKVSVFLQALSRIPGLGFLADTDRSMREAYEQVDEVGERYEEGQRHLEDIKHAAGDIVTKEDED